MSEVIITQLQSLWEEFNLITSIPIMGGCGQSCHDMGLDRHGTIYYMSRFEWQPQSVEKDSPFEGIDIRFKKLVISSDFKIVTNEIAQEYHQKVKNLDFLNELKRNPSLLREVNQAIRDRDM
jgi:hypothetical protein